MLLHNSISGWGCCLFVFWAEIGSGMAIQKIRYRKLSLSMHADEKYRSLSSPTPNAKTLWIHLLTGPHTDLIPGVSRAGEMAIAEELGWDLKGFREAFREISS